MEIKLTIIEENGVQGYDITEIASKLPKDLYEAAKKYFEGKDGPVIKGHYCIAKKDWDEWVEKRKAILKK